MKGSKAGISSNEKMQANELWKRYSIIGYLTSTDNDRFQTGTRINWKDITGFKIEKVMTSEKVVQQCRQLTIEGRKISAIKLYRQHNDVSLKEAKQFVDKLQTKTTF